MFDVLKLVSPLSRPELLILPAVDQNVDGGVEDEEKVGEECEDLTPHRPVVEGSRAVDQKKTDLQHNSLVTQRDHHVTNYREGTRWGFTTNNRLILLRLRLSAEIRLQGSEIEQIV